MPIPNCAKGEHGELDSQNRCEWCGKQLVDGKWISRCSICGKDVEKLVGLFVPHLCEGCLNNAMEADRKAGRVCGMCRRPYSDCCC